MLLAVVTPAAVLAALVLAVLAFPPVPPAPAMLTWALLTPPTPGFSSCELGLTVRRGLLELGEAEEAPTWVMLRYGNFWDIASLLAGGVPGFLNTKCK